METGPGPLKAQVLSRPKIEANPKPIERGFTIQDRVLGILQVPHTSYLLMLTTKYTWFLVKSDFSLDQLSKFPTFKPNQIGSQEL